MKGYEDVVAGLLLLIVVLIGGYVYLDSQVYKQKQVLQVPTASVPVVKNKITSEKTMFEVAVKSTE